MIIISYMLNIYLQLRYIYCSNNAREYYKVNEAKIPSYLFHKFTNIKENIFPNDFIINVSISKITGTLLYSLDKHMNQLILNLYDANTPTIGIEYNKQVYLLSLSKLCNCEQCRFIPLAIRIQMRDLIYVQCNEKETTTIKYVSSNQLNEAYPILFNQTILLDYKEPNEAYLWLVNTPQYENIYPNNEQFSGCIFNVLYNMQHVSFQEVSSNIERKCEHVCKGDICNGGQCYESYNKKPICNCTETFQNGLFCNDTQFKTNEMNITQNFIFSSLKLSWNCTSRRIMELSNKRIKLLLKSDNTTLLLSYEYTNPMKMKVQSEIEHNHIKDNNYILIILFKESSMEIKFIINGSVIYSIIPTNTDLRKEVFTFLVLRTNNGVIDLVYKISEKIILWRHLEESNIVRKNATNDEKKKVNINQHLKLGHSTITNNATDINFRAVSFVLGIICILAIMINIILWIVLYRK